MCLYLFRRGARGIIEEVVLDQIFLEIQYFPLAGPVSTRQAHILYRQIFLTYFSLRTSNMCILETSPCSASYGH